MTIRFVTHSRLRCGLSLGDPRVNRGAGMVGGTAAYAMVMSGVASELVLVDLNEKLAQAQVARLPPGRVLGSGTILESARLRTLIGEHVGVAAASVHANVLGERGDSEVLVWSGIQVGVSPLAAFAQQGSLSPSSAKKELLPRPSAGQTALRFEPIEKNPDQEETPCTLVNLGRRSVVNFGRPLTDLPSIAAGFCH